MSLNQLYLLRIIQLDVYIELLQDAINIGCSSFIIRKLREKQFTLMEERKEIRKFLNMTELWRIRNV